MPQMRLVLLSEIGELRNDDPALRAGLATSRQLIDDKADQLGLGVCSGMRIHSVAEQYKWDIDLCKRQRCKGRPNSMGAASPLWGVVVKLRS